MARLPLAAPLITGKRWDLEDDGGITGCIADAPLVKRAEGVWASRNQRRLVDWSWAQILRQSHETLALKEDGGDPVALWATAPSELLALPKMGPTYRLDFFEIDPARRGGVLGYYAVAIACVRALEAEAENLVLAALPATRSFWEDTIGAKVGRIHGWHVASSLLPCHLNRDTMENLRRDADARKSTAVDSAGS